MEKNKILAWWSGGVTSAVACKKAIDIFGVDRVEIVFIDTGNESEDTYRFKKDCEKWYGISIKPISCFKELPHCNNHQHIDIGKDYKNIMDVWFTHLSLNVATGAICSSQIKRRVREKYQEMYPNFDSQVFGFEFDKKEMNRALNLKTNHPLSKPIFPLLMLGLNKKDCISEVQKANIDVPEMYNLGFNNNNCFGTGCVQGGIGYWKKMQREFPSKFEKMASVEHQLTQLKGEPVTMLKDQSNEAKKTVKETGLKWKSFVFLKKNPDYPELKSLDDMKGRPVENLMDCNGFCGIRDGEEVPESVGDLNFTD